MKKGQSVDFIIIVSGLVSLGLLIWFVVTFKEMATGINEINSKTSRVLEHLEYMSNSSVFDEDSKTP